MWDWVVAHKRLLEALWDSAIERRGKGRDDGRRERGKENAQKPRNETEKMRGRRKGGGRGREEGETREEPRCSGLARGGLRLLLLAALRQLGGVRRGIEIANAHYGYFPIEGRIPLSLSLSPPSPGLLPRFSLFLLPLSFPRSLSSSFLPFTSLHRFIFFLSLSLFLRVLFSSTSRVHYLGVRLLIASFLTLSYCPAIFFSLSCSLFSRIFSLSLSLSRKTENARGKA